MACGVVDVCGDGTVLKRILVPGSGLQSPTEGCSVACHYVGRLPDGKQFDTSRSGPDATPFRFSVGSGVIDGWSDAVASMQVGERAVFTIASSKAYGEVGAPPDVPPNATLTFDIELISFVDGDDVTGDGGVVLKTVAEGEGWKTPKRQAVAQIDLKLFSMPPVGADDGAGTLVSDEAKLVVVDDWELPRGVDAALLKMKQGQSVVLSIAPEYGFGAAGGSELGVPPGAALRAELTLVDFENDKESYELKTVAGEADEPAQISFIEAKRADGNGFFKKKDYRRAARRYEKATDLLEDYQKQAATRALRDAVEPCDLNAAACYLKLRRFKAAETSCEKVLAHNPTSVKGLYRRGEARLALGELDAAKADLKQCLALDPTNKAARAALHQCQAKLSSYHKQQKARFGGMFDKMAAAAKPEPPLPWPDELELLMSMGFKKGPAMAALKRAGGDCDAAMEAMMTAIKPPDEYIPEQSRGTPKATAFSVADIERMAKAKGGGK